MNLILNYIKSKVGLLLLFALCNPILSVAQEIQEKLTSYVNSYSETGDFSGCILIQQNGEITYRNCFGKANLEFEISNTPETRFMIGSISKQFTAAAILLLQEKGLLDVNDSLSKYFPDVEKASQISIHQLLSHRSGLVDIYNVPGFNTLSCSKTAFEDLVQMVLDEDLQFTPGSRYQYSNGNYAVLASIIERVAKMDYGNFLKEHIFIPLEMDSTGHRYASSVVKLLASGYEPEGYSNLGTTDFLNPELLKGGGSLYSTIDNLLLWINQIKNRSLLTSESYDSLLTDHGNNYGYGISVYNSMDQEVFGHDGRLNGYIADYLHYRHSNATIILLGNIQTGVSDFFRNDIASIFFGREYRSRAKIDTPLAGAIENNEPYLGVYAFGPNFKVYIEENEGKIMARANQGGYSELIPLQDGRFFSRTLYAYITFRERENGKYATLEWTNNDGNSFEGKRE